MNLRLNVKCPYCGHNNKRNKEIIGVISAPEAIVCDNNEGGCDKYFVFSVTIATNVICRAIEGEK